MKNIKDFYINVPREILKSDNKNRASIILLYCFLVRYSSSDGIFVNTFENVINTLGSKFNKQKHNMTKFVVNLQSAFDYFYDNDYLILQKGNYHNHFELFVCKLDSSFFNVTSDYISISYAQFDYVASLSDKIDKAKIFDLMFWILNCSSKSKNGQIINACSYSVKYMVQVTGLNEMTILKYLSKLCGQPGSDVPIIKTVSKTLKIKNKYRRLPNIYVKNDGNYQNNIKNQLQFMLEKFREESSSEFDYGDYDDLFV